MAKRKAPGNDPQHVAPVSEAWNKLPWRKLEQHVYRIQKRMCAMWRTEVSPIESGGISRNMPEVDGLT
ncbi:MAG: hypothetical protein ACXVCM_00245 [Ktedonobacteraceae bacterium]